MDQIIGIIFMLIITYATGSIIEKNHFKKIKKREKALIRKPVVSFGAKKWNTNKKVKKIELVTGEVVVAGDYFKNFIAGIKNLFGGRLTTMESIMDRARREATLRMREKAYKTGAQLILNVRLESVMLNHVTMKNSIPKCAVIAYGTAVTFEK